MIVRKVSDSASWDGITIGLADAILTMMRVLDDRISKEAKRLRRKRERSDDEDWTWLSQEVQDAMSDLKHSDVAERLLYKADVQAMEIIREAAALLKRDAGDLVANG